MTSVYNIAEYINNRFGRLTKVKLQKLLYFCQAWHLGIYGSPLFDADFIAWPKGPAIKELHESMHDTSKLVPIKIKNSDPYKVSDKDADFIEKILSKYGSMSKDDLVELSHKDTSWKNTKRNNIISKEEIKSIYELREW